MWIGNNSALQTKIIAAFHASPIGGHSGITTTYHRIKGLFYWKGLKQAVESFVQQCDVCQHAKHTHDHPAGLLQPLPIPIGAWQDWSMDFVEGLPVVEGYSVILVVVDRLTKYAHFLPVRHPYTAQSIAKLLLDQVIRLHGFPTTIVSDRDKIFLSSFLERAVQATWYTNAYEHGISSPNRRADRAGESMSGNVLALFST